MRIQLDFEPGSIVKEAFRLQSFRTDAEPSDRLKNLNTELMNHIDKYAPKTAAQEMRRILINLNQEAARTGCFAAFEYCAGIVTEKTEQMHRKGDFSDRKSNFIDGGNDSFRNGRHSNSGGYDRRPGNGKN